MKILGYILSLLGIIFLVSSRFPQLSDKISSFLKFIPKESFVKYSIYIGGALILAGIVILIISLKSSPSSAPREVPIYEGNRVVGYRRH